MFIKEVKTGTKTYLYLVEGYRDPECPNRVKHQIIAKLGTKNNLNKEYMLKLAKDLLEHCDSDVIEVSQLKNINPKNWGGPTVIEK